LTVKHLNHLAVVIDMSSSEEDTAGPLFELFRLVTDRSFAIVGGLRCLSLFCPQTRLWPATPPSAKLGALLPEAFDSLEEAARRNGADLYLLGSATERASLWREILETPRARGSGTARVNLFIDYSSREEMTRAAAKILAGPLTGEIDEETFSSCLLTAGQPDPDLIIYTGETLEPKDFLLWQASYAEIWHCSRKGIDFCGEDLARAVESYGRRDRRFGRI